MKCIHFFIQTFDTVTKKVEGLSVAPDANSQVSLVLAPQTVGDTLADVQVTVKQCGEGETMLSLKYVSKWTVTCVLID